MRTALKDGAAQTKLVLELPQWRPVDRGGYSFRIAFAGDDKGEATVAICKLTESLVAGDEVEGRQSWTVVSVGGWQEGFKRLVLAAA